MEANPPSPVYAEQRQHKATNRHSSKCRGNNVEKLNGVKILGDMGNLVWLQVEHVPAKALLASFDGQGHRGEVCQLS